MREFFKGWRRKTGCITLVMACLFTSLWLITHQWCIEFVSAVGEPTQIVTARKNFLRWSSYRDINTTAAPFLWQSWPATHDQIEPMDSPQMRIEWDWHWSAGEFELGSGRCHGSPRQRMAVWAAPYWSIVWPLGLLSAWLILWKPRKNEVQIDGTPARIETEPPP